MQDSVLFLVADLARPLGACISPMTKVETVHAQVIFSFLQSELIFIYDSKIPPLMCTSSHGVYYQFYITIFVVDHLIQLWLTS